jgi:hypothetical protein
MDVADPVVFSPIEAMVLAVKSGTIPYPILQRVGLLSDSGDGITAIERIIDAIATNIQDKKQKLQNSATENPYR